MIFSFIEMGDFSQKLEDTDTKRLFYCSTLLSSEMYIVTAGHYRRSFTKIWSGVKCHDIHNVGSRDKLWLK